MDNPHYFVRDIMSLVFGIPYMRVRGSSLLPLLKSMAEAGKTYERCLPLHPLISCRPLDFHYQCFKCVCAMDEDLLRDLLFECSWREANVGAFIVMLGPRPGYRELLAHRRPTLLYGQDIIDLAIASIDGECATEFSERFGYVRVVREQFSKIRVKSVPLRLSPRDKYQSQYKAESAKVQSAYHEHGLSAATTLMHQGLLGYYNQPYKAWVMNGAFPLPSLASYCAFCV